MKRFSISVLLPLLSAAILFADVSSAKACCLFNWWGARRPAYSAYYSASFAPTYTAGYAPSYSAYYAPTYSASYVPSTSYYVSSVPTATGSACCDLRTTYSAPSACCAPCTACAPCTSCANCCPEDCPLDSAGASGSSSTPTPVTPRSDGRNPTFIEEEDRGRGSDYETDPMSPGTGDGFSPRGAADEGFDDSAREALKFSLPEAPAQEEPETHRVNRIEEPVYPQLNLDDKITSRPSAQRTRLISKRSWEQPVLAKNITREQPVENAGWVPVPLPTQLVQK